MEMCKFNQPFLSFQPKHIFDGNTLLLEFENNEYVYISVRI